MRLHHAWRIIIATTQYSHYRIYSVNRGRCAILHGADEKYLNFAEAIASQSKEVFTGGPLCSSMTADYPLVLEARGSPHAPYVERISAFGSCSELHRP